MSCPQIVDRFDSGEESVLKLFGRKGGSAQISTENVQFEIVTNNGYGRTLIVQSFEIGQFLSTGD